MLIAFLAASAIAVPPKPANDPSVWFSADSYPADALKNGIEGSVEFEVDVDRDGKPTACRVSKSSGEPILDHATCNVVLSKARFNPARDPDGKPISGKYSNTAVWEAAEDVEPGYIALILDFSKDPEHPTCVKQSVGPMHGATCAQLLQRLGTNLTVLGTRFTKMVVLESVAAADEQPYRGEADWGFRLGYKASDQYFLEGPKPVACVSDAAEGMEVGQDACAQFGGAHSPDENAIKNARKLRVEISTYGLPRK